MSEHSGRSSSPPRRLPMDLEAAHGHPPQASRLLVSPNAEAEHIPPGMLLAQLTEGLHRQSAEVMLNVGGVPVLAAQHPAFSLSQAAALRGAKPPPGLLTTQPPGMPILRGSGLVSLPPDMASSEAQRISPQQSRLHVPEHATIQGPMGSMVMLRVPSPSRSPVSRAHSRDPSPKPPMVIIEDSRGPSPRASPSSVGRPSAFTKKQPTVVHPPGPHPSHPSRASPNPLMRSSPHPPPPSGKGSAGAMLIPQRMTPEQAHRLSPIQQHRVSPVPAHRVNPATAIPKVHTLSVTDSVTHRASPSTAIHVSAPSHDSVIAQQLRASPLNRVTPNMQHRASPNLQHRASPGNKHRMSPNATIVHRASPNVHQRASPNVQHTIEQVLQHRSSPNIQSRIQHRPERRPSPNVQSRAPPSLQNRVVPSMPNQKPADIMAYKQSLSSHFSQGQSVEQTRHQTGVHVDQSPGRNSPVAHQKNPPHKTQERAYYSERQPRVVDRVSNDPVHARPNGSRNSLGVSNVSAMAAAQRVSPGSRVSSTQRVSPGPPGPDHRYLPETVITDPRGGSTMATSIASNRPHGHDGHIPDSRQNPFAAAMSSARSQGEIGSRTGSPSQQSQTLLNILVKNNPVHKAADEKAMPPTQVKQETPHTVARVAQSASTSLVTSGKPLLNLSQPLLERGPAPQLQSRLNAQPMLHKHLTTPISVAVDSQNEVPGAQPPALMPLLSSIMGLVPRSTTDDKAGSRPEHADLLDAMPRLMPETLPSHANRPVLLTPDQIKAEVDEKDEKKLIIMDNPFNLRVKNLENFPVNPSCYKTTYRSQGMAIHRAKAGCIMNTARSLDMLRHNLQKFINKEIDEVIQRYIEEFFKPGIENIRVNNGSNAVSDDHMAAVCRQILEEAKRMYMSGSRCTTPDNTQDNVSESGSLVPPENKAVRDKKLDLFKIKKRRGSSDSDASVITKKRKGRPPHRAGNGRSTPMKTGKNDPVKKEGPKWDPQRLTTEVKFVMGARANKALGLGAQRGRIYIKHPELFKYAGDQDDKNWLHENHHMPATGGKAYLLLVEDILEMSQSNEYKNNPGLMLNEVVGFSVPDWMIQKMKDQMQALRTDNIKSIKTKPAPSPIQLQGDLDNSLPFSQKAPSNADSKSDIQHSPSVTETMEVMSVGPDDDTPAVSPYNMSTSFPDNEPTPEVSPAPSNDQEETDEYEEDGPITAPFQVT